mmetsp:Transcript_59129/g.183303  ORF Transcript_59129/g.183303 Transcript_59129/m.183303 type:complete len:301 (+) Transcript_59129:119-1021(+)
MATTIMPIMIMSSPCTLSRHTSAQPLELRRAKATVFPPLLRLVMRILAVVHSRAIWTAVVEVAPHVLDGRNQETVVPTRSHFGMGCTGNEVEHLRLSGVHDVEGASDLVRWAGSVCAPCAPECGDLRFATTILARAHEQDGRLHVHGIHLISVSCAMAAEVSTHRVAPKRNSAEVDLAGILGRPYPLQRFQLVDARVAPVVQAGLVRHDDEALLRQLSQKAWPQPPIDPWAALAEAVAEDHEGRPVREASGQVHACPVGPAAVPAPIRDGGLLELHPVLLSRLRFHLRQLGHLTLWKEVG